MSTESETPAPAGIGLLAAALAAAQGEMTHAEKDRENPHFKSVYATLASVLEACRPALSKHKIAIIQRPTTVGKVVTVETMLVHESGQYISAACSSEARGADPQSIGSAITYLRRYALMSMVAIAPDDDDAEEATRGNQRPQQQRREDPPRQAAPPPPAEHHASWAKDQPGFFAKLKDLGVDYERLKTFLHLVERPKPSTMDSATRGKMLGALEAGKEFRTNYDHWLASTASAAAK